MNDTCFVCTCQRTNHAEERIDQYLRWQLPFTTQTRAKVLAFEEFHDQERHAIVDTHVDDVDATRMGDPASGTPLTQEAGTVRFPRHARGEGLERDPLVEVGMPRGVHDSRATPTDHFGQHVSPQTSAWSQGIPPRRSSHHTRIPARRSAA